MNCQAILLLQKLATHNSCLPIAYRLVRYERHIANKPITLQCGKWEYNDGVRLVGEV